MSWSAMGEAHLEGENLIGDWTVYPQSGVDDAYAEQYDVALAVAARVARVVGRSGRVNVTLAGHVNPNHEPGRHKYADEFVTISVTAIEDDTGP